MNKVIMFIVICLTFLSCKTIYEKDIIGIYKFNSKETHIKIQLSKDGEFKYERVDLSTLTGECRGKWSRQSAKNILVTCDSNDSATLDIISTGYIDSLRKELKIINKSKIDMDGVVLKKE